MKTVTIMKIHDVKCERESFEAVQLRLKKAELRKDDRDYEVGDGLHLIETLHGAKTGKTLFCRITHILRNSPHIPDGLAMLSVDVFAGGLK